MDVIKPEPLADAEGVIPPSPCIRVCRMDESGRCLGCGRSAEEIRRYGERVLAARRRKSQEKVPTDESA
jgi:predicted Fe-S protein YdhL (DUF1289 family)